MNIENIIIEGSGSGTVSGSFFDEEIDFSYSEENLLNQKYFLTIYKADDELEIEEEIGYVEMNYIDVWMAEELGWSTFDLFDLIDEEKKGVHHYLFDEDDEPNFDYVGIQRDVMYIERIFIEKKYRKMGIGSKVIQELPTLIKQILKLRPGCIVLLANPFEREDNELKSITDKNEIEKLIEFYIKNGFKRIEDTQYLVKNMDYI